MTFTSDLDLTRLAAVPQHVKDKYLALIMTPSPLSDEDYERMLDLGEQIRSALTPPPLRTRAEVDAEIAAEVRCWRDNVKTGAAYHSSPSPSSIEKFERLCAEPVRGDDPPQPERMTESLRDLCRSLRAGGTFGGAEVAMYIEACFPDERRQQTKGATEPDTRLPGSVRTPGTVETSVAPKEPCAYMNNDEARAREAALDDYLEGEEIAEGPSWKHTWHAAWKACREWHRATGQLCTPEERAVLEASGGVSLGALEAYLEIAGEHGSPRMAAWVKAELARRAKGGSDVG